MNCDFIEFHASKLAQSNEGRQPTMEDVRSELGRLGMEFPVCPCGGEYTLDRDDNGSIVVKCSFPRHD